MSNSEKALRVRAANHRASRLGYLYSNSDAELDEDAAAIIEKLMAALKSAEQEIAQLCRTVNTCSEKAGLGRKVRPEDFGEKVRAALTVAEGVEP
jgi:hypothetical protein